MPRGDEDAFTYKQKRKDEHIEECYEKPGSGEETERCAGAVRDGHYRSRRSGEGR